MTRLEEIKNEIAKEMQAEDAWVDMKHFKESTYQSPIIEKYYNRIIERYARECCIATQKKCAENASTSTINSCIYCMRAIPCDNKCEESYTKIDQDSITNPENIVLV